MEDADEILSDEISEGEGIHKMGKLQDEMVEIMEHTEGGVVDRGRPKEVKQKPQTQSSDELDEVDEHEVNTDSLKSKEVEVE